ncbi:MAG TPA: MFS transporter [Anaerolineales bacterium]|nr:MFS transporter [Anaerolineales bacterium]
MATNADNPSFDLTIPTITHEFGAGFFATQLMSNVAQLMVAAFVLAAGSFGDLFGRKKWLLLGTIGLLVGYVLQSLALNVTMIIAARILVGFSTAVTTALTLAVVTQAFGAKEGAKAIGIFAGAGSFSAAAMPIISQYFNQSFGWRFSFVVPLLLSGAGLLMAWKYLVESKDPNPRKLDKVGILLNAFGLTGIVYGFILMGSSGWGLNTKLWLLFGAIGIAAFIWWEKKTPDPALKLSLFKSPAFAIAVGVGLIMNLVDFGMHPILSMFLQSVQGRTPLAASFLLLPWALGAAVIAPFAGRWATRIPARKLMTIGFILSAIFSFATVLFTVDATALLIIGVLTPYALAYGLINIPRTALLMASAPENESGAASGANSMGIETGTALGIAVFNTLVARNAIKNYSSLLKDAGASAAQIDKAIEVVKSAVEGAVGTRFASLDSNLLSQLLDGFKESYTLAIGQSFTIGALLLAICAGVVWFGLRGKENQV